jgi:hypothetical protein
MGPSLAEGMTIFYEYSIHPQQMRGKILLT